MVYKAFSIIGPVLDFLPPSTIIGVALSLRRIFFDKRIYAFKRMRENIYSIITKWIKNPVARGNHISLASI